MQPMAQMLAPDLGAPGSPAATRYANSASSAPGNAGGTVASATPEGQPPESPTTPPADTGIGWRANLPKEWRDHALVKEYAKPGDFIQAAALWKDKASRALSVPGESATQEERDEFFRSLGAPEKPDDYSFDHPQGYQSDKNLEDFLRKTVHEARLSKAQGSLVMKAFASLIQDGRSAISSQAERRIVEQNDLISKKYGADLKVAEELAKRGLMHSGVNKELFGVLKDTGVLRHPLFFDWAAGLGKMFQEDSFGGPSSPTSGPDDEAVFDYSQMKASGY